MEETKIQGGCLCGKVQYELTGNSFGNSLCHCVNCQKLSGSLFSANSIYKDSQFRIIQGQSNVKKYSDPATQSGIPVNRHFCDNCGSCLFNKSENPKFQDFVIVTSGTMDPDSRKWQPQREFYCVGRAKWLPHIEGVQMLQGL